ncbi:MAG: poly(3-hydroxybutyrate) depolymerase [Gammaproteobacteria bacterium]
MTNFDFNKLKEYTRYPKNIYALVFLLPFVLALFMVLTDESIEAEQMGNAVYTGADASRCAPGSRSGSSGATYGETSSDGIKYNVRTPLNYNPGVAHSLLMVYAPARANRARTEAMTGLTADATAAGFIVAYADHPEFSSTTALQLGAIPGLIAEKWCIDEQRIFLTGHSDGATVSMALGLMSAKKDFPTAIAPSAAGFNYPELSKHDCPAPLSVMVMHSAKDRLFPGYGAESAGWWAVCNDCDPIPDKLDNGCIEYPNCRNGVKTWFCEGDKPHPQWPAMNRSILEFFKSIKSR